MMAFITPFSRSMPNFLLRLLWLCCLLVPLARAAEVEVVQPQLVAGEEAYTLSADFNFEFNPRLEEAVAKGVVLYFVVDFEMNRPRWYWVDEKVLSRTQTFRLSYQPLTRQYRLATGALHRSFASLPQALEALSRLRGWTVIEKSDAAYRPGETYMASLRFRLDINQLPRPFQISAIGNKEWTLGSDWKIWQATLPVPEAPR